MAAKRLKAFTAESRAPRPAKKRTWGLNKEKGSLGEPPKHRAKSNSTDTKPEHIGLTGNNKNIEQVSNTPREK